MNEAQQQALLNAQGRNATRSATPPRPQADPEFTRLDFWRQPDQSWRIHKCAVPLYHPRIKHPYKETILEVEEQPAGFDLPAHLAELAANGWTVITCAGFARAWLGDKRPVRHFGQIHHRREVLERNPPSGLSLVEVRHLDLLYYL